MINFDLNQADEQSSGFQVIPNNSVVWVRLEIQSPEAGQAGSMPELTRSKKSSLQYMATKLIVCYGQFKDKELYNNFNLDGASTDGHNKAIKISMAQLRAILEAKNQISKNDQSERAVQLRKINSLSELNGALFPIKVSCALEKNQDGDMWARNNVKKILTIDDPEYTASAQAGYELITDEPIPENKKAEASQANQYAAPPVQAPPMQQQGTFQAPPMTPPSAQPQQYAPPMGQTAQPYQPPMQQAQQGFNPPPMTPPQAPTNPAPGWATGSEVNNSLGDMPF